MSFEEEMEGMGEYVGELEQRIEELEAPFKLVDKPPSVPGWYVALAPDGYKWISHWHAGPHLENVRAGYKWGSAPLPMEGE